MGNTGSKNLGIDERVGVKSGIPTESKLYIAKEGGKNLKDLIANPTPNIAKAKSISLPEISFNVSQKLTPGVASVLCQ